MAQDRYTQWLKIPPGERPPDHYTLLGLPHFCDEKQRISQASHDRLDELDKYALSKDPASRADCQRIMNEVARALVVLTDAGKRLAYDVELSAKLGIAPPQAMIMPAQEPGQINEQPRVQPEPAHPQPARTTARPAPVSSSSRIAPARAPQVAQRQRPVPLSAEPTTRRPLILMLSVSGAALSVVALIVLLIVFMTQDRDPSLAPDANATYIVTPDPQGVDRLPPNVETASGTPAILAHPEMEEARARCLARLQECRDDKSIMPLIDKWGQRDWQYILTAIEQGEDVLATPASRTAQYEKAFDKLGEVMTHARRTAEIIKTTRGPYDKAIALIDEEIIRTHLPTDWSAIESSLRNATIGALNHQPETATRHFENAAKRFEDAATKALAMNLPKAKSSSEPPAPVAGKFRLVPVGEPFKGPYHVQYLQFSPNGKLLAACGENEVLLWDVDAGKANADRSLLPEPAGIVYFNFSPDGKKLHHFTRENISTWDLTNLQTAPTKSANWKLAGPLVVGGPYVAFAINPGGKELEVWDVTTCKAVSLLKHGSSVRFHAISDDGNVAITRELNQYYFQIWNPKIGHKVATRRSVEEKNNPGTNYVHMALSPDGKKIASGFQQTVLFPAIEEGKFTGKPLYFQGEPIVVRLQYSTDGKRLLIGLYDPKFDVAMRESLQIYDLIQERLIAVAIPSGGDGVTRFRKPTWRCSPDGKLLAIGGAAGVLRVIHLDTGKPVADDINIGDTIWDIAFSPDSKLLAVLYVDALVQIYRLDP